MLLSRGETYDEVYGGFSWEIPEFYNIANDVCDRHADRDPESVALIVDEGPGKARRYTFGEIRTHANRLASWFGAIGMEKGERVSILLAQNPVAAITHVASWKAGLVSSPMSILFGPDAIEYRLRDLGSRVLITDQENYPKVAALLDGLPQLEHVLVIDGAPGRSRDFWETIAGESESFENVRTRAGDIAYINYTSGTTGNPKGAMQPHRQMLGHVPGLEFLFDRFSRNGEVIWSPADWAWLAGLMNILMFGWFHGKPVLAEARTGFDAEEACRMMHEHGVSHAMLTPTMLKVLRQVPDALKRYPPKLKTVVSGTESVGKELLAWANQELGCTVNEGFGQTECNVCIGNCARVMPIKMGSLGRALPGHVVAIVDDDGNKVTAGTVGNIAVCAPDPVMMLGYWNRPEKTREKYAGDWLITGDLGSMDKDGYIWFQGRRDDVITSSGYRIGPGEVEDALIQHPAVAMAAVIGVPDPVRTEIVKAFVVLNSGYEPGKKLEEDLRESVKTRLARYEYPREIEFLESLPLTVTGKVLRRELRERELRKRKDAGEASPT